MIDGMDAGRTRYEVSVRQLRYNLSRCLAAVRDGSEVVVTDDGYQVASIVPRAAHGPARFTRRLRGSGPRFVPEPIEIDITDEELDRIVQESR